jgi:hypothetical protein
MKCDYIIYRDRQTDEQNYCGKKATISGVPPNIPGVAIYSILRNLCEKHAKNLGVCAK